MGASFFYWFLICLFNVPSSGINSLSAKTALSCAECSQKCPVFLPHPFL